MKEAAEKKPRRKLTVADHIAAFDARIARLEAELEGVKGERRAYIIAVKEKAAEQTSALPQE